MLKFGIARTKKEKLAAYHLRYKVFGEIHGYLDNWQSRKRPYERDAYDKYEETVSFLAWDDEKPVGTVRLIEKNDRNRLHIEKYCSLASASGVAEASRLCVLPEYRGRKGAVNGRRIVNGLCKMYFTYALYHGVRKIYVLANVNKLHEGKALQTHSRMGFVPTGEEFYLKKFSEFAIPMISDLDHIPVEFKRIMAENWDCIERPYNLCLFPDLNVKEFWNEFAETCYDDYLDLDHYQGLLDCVTGFVGKGASVADIGCGTGNMLARLSNTHQGRLIGVDISEKMLMTARLKVKHPAVEFHQADATRLPLPDKAVDTSLALNLLFHFDDPSIVLRELKRITRQYIVISGPLEGENIIRQMKTQTNGLETAAVNYNRILLIRDGIRFRPDVFSLMDLARDNQLKLVKYDQVYDGLMFVAKFALSDSP